MRHKIQVLVIVALLLQNGYGQEKAFAAEDMMRLNASEGNSNDVFPRFWGTGIVFASDRSAQLGRKQKNYDLYMVNDTAQVNAVKLKGRFNSRYNETSPYLTKDGNTLYFSRNDFDENFARRPRLAKLPLQTFAMQKKGKRWKRPKLLPFNSNTYSVAHVVLNEDEDTLYFVSDMPGGYGGMDLYKVEINEDGNYGTPQNLGNTINTERDETGPFISGNTLYFSSEGHDSKGGMDIFKADLITGKVNAMEAGINTAYDDYGFILDKETKMAFFSSDRAESSEATSIYMMDYDPNTMRKEEEKKNENAIVGTTGNKNNGVGKTNGTGNPQANTTGALTENGTNNSTNAMDKDRLLTARLSQEFSHIEKVIYFRFDSAVVEVKYHGPLDRLAAFMEKHKNVEIMLTGHTDYIGDNEYNRMLSKRRANAVRDYLIGKGILANRISLEGRGEDEPVSNCETCTKTELGRDRRVEIDMRQE